MKRKGRRWASVMFAGAMLAGLWAASGNAEQTGEVDVEDIMQAKLVASQDLLAGLANEDFEEIARSAQQLRMLSLDAGWQVLQTTEYARHSDDFGRAAQAVTEAGRNENLDAAVLGYVELTLTCVACHRYVRDAD